MAGVKRRPFVAGRPRVGSAWQVIKEIELPYFEARERIIEVPMQLIEESCVEVPRVERLEVIKEVPKAAARREAELWFGHVSCGDGEYGDGEKNKNDVRWIDVYN